MKIKEAIEILELYYREVNIDPPLHFNDALKLGIEALKVISKIRHYPFPEEILELPGETED